MNRINPYTNPPEQLTLDEAQQMHSEQARSDHELVTRVCASQINLRTPAC